MYVKIYVLYSFTAVYIENVGKRQKQTKKKYLVFEVKQHKKLRKTAENIWKYGYFFVSLPIK